jgi:hypothetical protein
MREDPSRANDVLKSLRGAGPSGLSATRKRLVSGMVVPFVRMARQPILNLEKPTYRIAQALISAQRF